MKLNTKKLKTALDNLAKITARKMSLPILSCVKLSAANNLLTIEASNLDEYQTETVECDGETGAFCVSAKHLSASVGGSEMDLEWDGKKLTIKWDTSIFRVPTLASDDFPPAPSEKASEIGLNCGDLAKGISAVLFAASDESNRYVLNSVHLQGKPKSITCVATNGRMLAVHEANQIAAAFEALVPREFAPNFCAALNREDAVFSVSEKHLFAHHKSGMYLCKQIEESYPNWKQVVPTEFKVSGTLPVAPMVEAFSRCAAFYDEKSFAVKLDFQASGVQFTYDGERGNVEKLIDGKFEPLIIALDFQYMTKICNAFDCESVSFSGTDELSALVFQSNDLKTIIMPMRLT